MPSLKLVLLLVTVFVYQYKLQYSKNSKLWAFEDEPIKHGDAEWKGKGSMPL